MRSDFFNYRFIFLEKNITPGGANFSYLALIPESSLIDVVTEITTGYHQINIFRIPLSRLNVAWRQHVSSIFFYFLRPKRTVPCLQIKLISRLIYRPNFSAIINPNLGGS